MPNTQGSDWDASAAPWSGKIAVLVTSLDPVAFPTLVMPKHYRDRGDAENNFDELKNQWGWNGYTSKRLASSRLMANLIALIYNWSNLYLRFYDEEHHREAIRTRPMLMSGVGRQVQSGAQKTVKVSVLHEKGDLIAQAVTRTSNELHQIRCHCGAMDCRAVLDADIDPRVTPLAGRKVASRPAGRRPTTPQRIKTAAVSITHRKCKTF